MNYRGYKSLNRLVGIVLLSFVVVVLCTAILQAQK